MMQAVITGASGFIGRELIRCLLNEQWTVHALVGTSTVDIPGAIAVDIRLRASVVALQERIPRDAVFFHLAGRAHQHSESTAELDEYKRVNVDGTVNALELARSVRASRFVLAGSVAVYGNVVGPADEETVCVPVTPYGESKLQAERVLRDAVDTPPWTILRFPMVYGRKDRGNMTRIVDAIRRNRFPPLPTINNRRSILHVADAADALLFVATHSKAVRQTFVVAQERPVSTSDIYDATLRALGRPEPRVALPFWALRVLARMGDLGGRVARRKLPLNSDAVNKLTESAEFSSRKIAGDLGFRTRRTLDEGIRTILDDLAAS